LKTIESTLKKITDILPENIGISTGYIVDIHNQKSKPMDIVIYEKDYCTEKEYFPCEHVIAAGIMRDLIDADKTHELYEDIESVKILNRNFNNQKLSRTYGSKETVKNTKEEDCFNQKENQYDQIYAFVLCENVTNRAILEKKGSEIIKKKPAYLLPNLIIALHEYIFFYQFSFTPTSVLDGSDYKDIDSNRDGIFPANEIEGRRTDWPAASDYLVERLQEYFNKGRTTDCLN
jgi:hypothetical protein